MSQNIVVAKYPDDKGKLFRSAEGIIYASISRGVVALGCDIKNTGYISPFDSTHSLPSREREGVLIDDSLAREYQSKGGLVAVHLVVNNTSVVYNPSTGILVPTIPFQTYQPVSLVKMALDYIVKNPEEKEFNLELLPKKLKGTISSRLELNKTRNELEKIRLQNQVTLTELKCLHINHITEKKHLHLQEISQLESAHLRATAKLKRAANKEEDRMLYLISELEVLVIEYS